VPILIPSRADKSDAKLLSVALGIIMSEHVGSDGRVDRIIGIMYI
jgi:hypothetical protein